MNSGKAEVMKVPTQNKGMFFINYETWYRSIWNYVMNNPVDQGSTSQNDLSSF